MTKKYNYQTIEEFIHDQEFVETVRNLKSEKEWQKLLENNSESKDKILQARKFISLFSVQEGQLSSDRKHKLWSEIKQHNHTDKKKTRSIQLRRVVGIAASVLVVVSMSILGYSYLRNQSSSYQFTSAEVPVDQSESRLILPDGEEVLLEKDNSLIALNKGDELVIDNEKTIDLSERKNAKANEIQMNEVIVPYGKSSELLLADGTKVWLNAGSRLAFPSKFSGDSREVFLEGEGCFKVTHDDVKEFVVNTNKLEITVHGTFFNVSAYPADDNIETILVEGSVSVAKKSALGINTKDVFLKPYQSATFSKQAGEIEIADEPNADYYVAWTEGWFEFTKQNLITVLTKLERYYNVEFVIPENFPSEERISGKLDLKGTVEDVMKVLADVAEIQYRIIDNRIEIDKEN